MDLDLTYLLFPVYTQKLFLPQDYNQNNYQDDCPFIVGFLLSLSPKTSVLRAIYKEVCYAVKG